MPSHVFVNGNYLNPASYSCSRDVDELDALVELMEEDARLTQMVLCG
jgi:hypothetical protein